MNQLHEQPSGSYRKLDAGDGFADSTALPMSDGHRTLFPASDLKAGVGKRPDGAKFIQLQLELKSIGLFTSLTPEGARELIGALSEAAGTVEAAVAAQAAEVLRKAGGKD